MVAREIEDPLKDRHAKSLSADDRPDISGGILFDHVNRAACASFTRNFRDSPSGCVGFDAVKLVVVAPSRQDWPVEIESPGLAAYVPLTAADNKAKAGRRVILAHRRMRNLPRPT